MTDPIEFKDEVDLPPVIIDDPEYPNGSVITFEKVEGRNEEIRINLQIRDENVAQTLKVRTLVTTSTTAIVYGCPEPVAPAGSVLREYPVTIPQSVLSSGQCHKVQVAVSGHFTRCRDDDEDLARRLFDDVEVAHSDDIARATFWVWETSSNVLGDPAATQALALSCQTIMYESASPTIP